MLRDSELSSYMGGFNDETGIDDHDADLDRESGELLELTPHQ